jgi:DeoR/GlpR family transcriptional regulator of sugar metabolism
MLKREGPAYILNQLTLQRRVLSTDLSHLIKVSDDIIRRDQQEVASANNLVKVHGGALSISPYKKFKKSTAANCVKEKYLIARKAASLVKNGMFVLTGGNTTIIEFVRCVPTDLHATFVSGSIPAIKEYMNYPNIDVIVLGDKLSKNSKLTAGAHAISQIKQINADICFLGINALDLHNGITDNDWDVVQIKKAIVQSSKKVVCLSTAEKLNRVLPIQVCDTNRIDVLITDLLPTDSIVKPYLEAGIQVL